MWTLALATCKGFIRDRVFKGIMVGALFLLLVPALSNISMRQTAELSISLSLSLVSLELLLLSVFLGGTTLWRDIDRRYIFGVLGLPLSRNNYIWGKFIGVVLCLILSTLFLCSISLLVIKYVAMTFPPDRQVNWLNIVSATGFDLLKYILLVALAFLFSSISTSFFLPIFSTISFFMLGSVSQQVYDYIHSPMGTGLSEVVKVCGSAFYYIIPNFTLYNLKHYAVYSIDIPTKGMLLPLVYFIIVLGILMSAASILFSKRDLK